MTVGYIQQKIQPILEEYNISYAALFGSIARGEDRKTSDVDLMIRFGKPLGMFAYMKFINGLELALDKKVDVVTEKSINKFIKPYIIPDIKVIYEK